MDRIYKPNLTQVNNVGRGQKFSCELPIGPAYRYVDILVTYTPDTGLTAAAITDFLDLVEIMINGKPFRTFLATEADKIHKRYGSAYAALICRSSGSGDTLKPILSSTSPAAPTAATQTTCKFRIFFEEPWRKTWAAAGSRKLHTSWPAKAPGGASQVLSSFVLQATIPATANNLGATGLAVRILTGTDNEQGVLNASGDPVTTSLKWYRYPGVTYTAAGDQQLVGLVKYDKGKVLSILEETDIFSQSTGDQVDRLQVNADGRIIFDATSLANMDDLVRHGFNPVWDLDQFAYVADANDNFTDALVLSTPGGRYVNTLVQTATLGAAAGSNKTLVVINQVIGPLD